MADLSPYSQYLQKAVKADTQFLSSKGIMDYSFLLAVEAGSGAEEQPHSGNVIIDSKHKFRNRGEVYHIAIIDYLQGWDCGKKAERCLKVAIGRDGQRISVAEPAFYAARFRRFMESNVIYNNFNL